MKYEMIYSVLLLLFLPSPLLAHFGNDNFGHHMGAIGGWGFWGGWIIMLLFWGLIIAGVFYLIKGVSGTRISEEKERYMEILKERYAKGEITKEEFDQKKKELSE